MEQSVGRSERKKYWAVRKKTIEQISFSGNDDVLTDTTCKTRKDHVIKRMPNVNITGTETEKIKLVWIHQGKRKRQPLKKIMDMVVPGRRRWLDNTRKI